MAWRALAALSMLLCMGSACCDDTTDQFISKTTINNVVQDPHTSRIYLGAINAIYQLNSDLKLESTAVTGPKKDHPQCTPPITSQCTNSKDTDNINKLLLVNSAWTDDFKAIVSIRRETFWSTSEIDHTGYIYKD